MEYQISDNVAWSGQNSHGSPQGACPNCGHCPHCGRGGQRFVPYNPWPNYPQPYIGDLPGWYGGATTAPITTIWQSGGATTNGSFPGSSTTFRLS